jgi:hypothetical protein
MTDENVARSAAELALAKLRAWGNCRTTDVSGNLGLLGREYREALSDAWALVGSARRLQPALYELQRAFILPLSDHLAEDLEAAYVEAAKLLRAKS